MENQDQKSKKKFYHRWWFWIIIIIVIAIGGNGNNPQKIGTSTPNSNPNSNQNNNFKVGDQIKIGDTNFSVIKVTKNWKSSNQFDSPSNPDDVFVVISVSIVNTGSNDLDLSGLWDFKLEDANGVKKNQSIGGIGLKKLPTGSLSTNGKASGDIIFEVDKNSLTNLKLHYSPLFSLEKTVTIELQ